MIFLEVVTVLILFVFIQHNYVLLYFVLNHVGKKIFLDINKKTAKLERNGAAGSLIIWSLFGLYFGVWSLYNEKKQKNINVRNQHKT